MAITSITELTDQLKETPEIYQDIFGEAPSKDWSLCYLGENNTVVIPLVGEDESTIKTFVNEEIKVLNKRFYDMPYFTEWTPRAVYVTRKSPHASTPKVPTLHDNQPVPNTYEELIEKGVKVFKGHSRNAAITAFQMGDILQQVSKILPKKPIRNHFLGNGNSKMEIGYSIEQAIVKYKRDLITKYGVKFSKSYLHNCVRCSRVFKGAERQLLIENCVPFREICFLARKDRIESKDFFLDIVKEKGQGCLKNLQRETNKAIKKSKEEEASKSKWKTPESQEVFIKKYQLYDTQGNLMMDQLVNLLDDLVHKVPHETVTKVLNNCIKCL